MLFVTHRGLFPMPPTERRAEKCICSYQFDPILTAKEVDHHLEVLGQITCRESKEIIEGLWLVVLRIGIVWAFNEIGHLNENKQTTFKAGQLTLLSQRILTEVSCLEECYLGATKYIGATCEGHKWWHSSLYSITQKMKLYALRTGGRRGRRNNSD